jgi:hypothetical protein
MTARQIRARIGLVTLSISQAGWPKIGKLSSYMHLDL